MPKFVTRCETCNNYWNTKTISQASTLKEVHLDRWNNHEIICKELDPCFEEDGS